MALPHHEVEIFYIHLLDIEPIGSTSVLRYQNYKPGVYDWNSYPYNYAPFVVSSRSRKLELDSPEFEIIAANVDIVRESVKAFDGFRKAIVRLSTVFPDRLDAPVDSELLQVASASYTQGSIRFTLQSPLSAVTGKIPSRHFDLVLFPELPVINQARL